MEVSRRIFLSPMPRRSTKSSLWNISAMTGFRRMDGTLSTSRLCISVPSGIPPGEYISSRSSYMSTCTSLPMTE
jgi:hypothetical protein